MLKYSTGRSKPGWGKHEYRPVWWPEDVPWANVRSDVRTEEMKKKVSLIIQEIIVIFIEYMAKEGKYVKVKRYNRKVNRLSPTMDEG